MDELEQQDLRYDEALAAYDLMALPDDLDTAAPLEDMDVGHDADSY